MKKLVYAVCMVAVALIIVTLANKYTSERVGSESETAQSTTEAVDESGKIVVWYSYQYYSDYFDELGSLFAASNGVSVEFKYVSSTDILDDAYAANLAGTDIPDLIIIGSENLEEAYLMGLTKENTYTDIYNTTKYSYNALSACTYRNKLYAYPLGYESAVFVYNKAYITDAPETFDDITTFNETYGTDEEDTTDYSNISNVLVWDVSDIMYNYGFIGSQISFSGNYTDGNEKVTINYDNLVSALEQYKAVYDYFSIGNDSNNYDEIVSDFADGKIVFSILNIESLRELDESDVEYGACLLPSFSDTINNAMLTVTDVVVVNPYSDDIDMAEKLAEYLTTTSTYSMYNSCGVLPCKILGYYENEALEVVAQQYISDSVSLPNMINLSDYWLKVQDLFDAVAANTDYSEYIDSFIESLSQDVEVSVVNKTEETETEAETETETEVESDS